MSLQLNNVDGVECAVVFSSFHPTFGSISSEFSAYFDVNILLFYLRILRISQCCIVLSTCDLPCLPACSRLEGLTLFASFPPIRLLHKVETCQK